MANFSRSTWASILFIGLFAPVAVYILFLVAPLPKSSPRTGGGAVEPAATRGALQAAGDGRTLWLARPVVGADRMPAYELFDRAPNSGIWSIVRVDEETRFSGVPTGLAAVSDGSSALYVITDAAFFRFDADGKRIEDRLPVNHTLLAATGSPAGVFALTAGPRDPSTTRPGDRLRSDVIAPAATRSSATGSAPASLPVEAASASAPRPVRINAYRFRSGRWIALADMGLRTAGRGDTPAAGARVALMENGHRLTAYWVNVEEPQVLRVRYLDDADLQASWSPVQTSALPESLPANTRLFAATISGGGKPYLFWAVAGWEGQGTAALRGGRLVNDALSAESLLPPVKLGAAPANFNPATDVALGVCENSFVAIAGRGGGADSLTAHVFDARGDEIRPSAPVEPQIDRHPALIVQNVMLLLIMVLASLSLWQWRQRPRELKLPEGSMAAPLRLRGIEFAIDFGIALVVTAAIFGNWDVHAWGAIFAAWMGAFGQPQDLVEIPEIPVLLGLYLAQVTFGELFFRRSIGKALVGTQVLMADGAAPTVAAILLRNLMRVFELIPGILTLYIIFSAHRQRLGDVLAGTFVVSQKPPETPADPDAKRDDAGQGPP